uniref:Proteasome 20S subunit beta 13a n=1 Tax=Gouania willdenowi TaxID=441366 RepID=A0A8C5E2P2_GOUWI
MALSSVLQSPAPGFNFDNAARNAALGRNDGGHTPKPLKTGTTIDGVVLGLDTRACAKIHYISPNIYCCGAGTAADTEKTTDLLSSNLTIFSLNSGRNPRVVMAANILQDMLYRYRGQIGANLILGGVDCTGNHLYKVGPYGSVDKTAYLSMGSGDLAALGILEDGFKPDLEMEQAKDLVRAAIQAGIMSDLGSGNNIDICVITRDGVDYIRPYQESETIKYKYRPGTTRVLTEKVVPLKLEVVHESVKKMVTG